MRLLLKWILREEDFVRMWTRLICLRIGISGSYEKSNETLGSKVRGEFVDELKVLYF
jgi:hypothetical protein